MEERRKAQITIFIILSLIILIVIIGFFAFRTLNKDSFNFLSFNQQAEILQESIKECMESVYKNSLNTVGIQGGYFNEPLTYYVDIGYDIPFYYFGEINYIPTKELMEEELVFASEFKDLECLDLITERNIDYDFSYNSVNVSVNNKSVTFQPNLEITLKKDEKVITQDLSNFPITINSNLNEMNAFASYITYSYTINNGSLCISCFSEIADEYEFIVEFSNELESVLLVSIIENRTGYHPQIYSFALTELSQFNDNELIVESIPDLEEVDQDQEEKIVEPPDIS